MDSKGLYSKAILIALAFSFCAVALYANEAEDRLKEFLKVYEDSTCILRATINHSTVTYLDPPLDSLGVFAERKDDRWFLYMKDRPVTITGTDVKDDGARIEIRYESRDLDEQKVAIISPLDTSIDVSTCKQLLHRIFAFDNAPFPRFWYDTLNQIIHVRGNNHVNEHSVLIDQTDIEARQVKRCPACFRQRVEIPGYQVEMALREGAVEVYQLYHPISYSDSLQEIVRRTGEKVLANWPMPLRGYNYQFYVTSSQDLNAVAFPAGMIYLHEGVLNLVEDSIELEAIVAHEIAHVELRHAYRTLLKHQKKAFWSGILSLGAAITAGALTNDADVAASVGVLSVAISEIAVNVSLAGYNRDQEIEADNIAALYLTKQYGSEHTSSLSRILSKMVYAENVVERSAAPSSFASHPKTLERAINLRETTAVLTDPVSFMGRDSVGREVAQFSILSIYGARQIRDVTPPGSRLRQPTRIDTTYFYTMYAAVSTSEFLYSAKDVKHMNLKTSDENYRFDNKEDTELAPLSMAGCVFEMTTSEPISTNRVRSIDPELGMKLEWVKVDDSATLW